VVTSNRGATGRRSPSGQRNASFVPPTKSFAQAIPENEPHKKRRLANLRLVSRLSLYYDGKLVSIPLSLYCGWFSHLSTREIKLAGSVLCSAPVGHLPELRASNDLCDSPL